MHRSTCVQLTLTTLLSLAIHFGCTIEVDEHLDQHLVITGKVTYHGETVKRGVIHFLPIDPANPPSSGVIADGAIKDVFTRKPGDGVRSGKYKIAITAFDKDLAERAAKRTPFGPDPNEVTRIANQTKKLIPLRYANVRESGLTAEFSLSAHSLELDLVD